MSEPDETVTLQRACIELGGVKPYSEVTVRRMIRDHAIDAYGAGRLLRIDMQSIRDYKAGRRTWHRSTSAANAAQAPSSGSRTDRGSPARQTKADQVVFLTDRRATGKQKKRSKSGTAQ